MNQILAALIFFTRLPFWKIKEVPQECFKHVVNYWSFSGWLTGGMMALIFWGASTILPHGVAVILALTSRLLITGALHEDGLADFFDGFGGGTNRESTLRIMKDSHIGSYGVLGLIIYYLFAYNLLVALPLAVTPFLLLSGDTWSKFISSNIINYLPYARKEEDSKSGTVYTRMNFGEIVMSAMGGILPLLLLPPSYWPVCIFPILVFFFICRMMKRRLNGYTGDCCIISPKRNEFLAGSSDVYLYKISKPMNIYLIRHTSVDVPKGLCYGQSDVPLRPTFEIEAAVTKAKIESIHFDMAYTSPLSRCTRLAQYCGFGDAIRDPRILELNFGDWEMQYFHKIKDPNLQCWYDDYLNVKATNGESFADQYKRVAAFLDEVRQKEGENTVVFAHGGVLICAQIYAKLIHPEEAFQAVPAYGGVFLYQECP